jgi:signal transduction histidine kinase
MGVRLQATLATTLALAVALGLASVALFAALDASVTNSTKTAAIQNADAKAALLGGLQGAGQRSGKQGAGKQGGGLGGNGLQGNGLQGGGTPPLPPGAAAGPGSVRLNVVDGAGGTQLVEASKTVVTEKGLVQVKGQASMAPARAAMNTLTGLLIPGVPALLALVALFTWLAVGRALRPVAAIQAKVADITAHGLHERVPEPDTRDEIGALARTVNATLDRLQTAVGAHRQFVADAAHELRSPMTILRTRLELAGTADRQLVDGALDDVRRLQSLTADLLLLARLDAGEPVRATELDLAQLVAEEADRRRPRPEVRIRLRLTPDLLVDGSPERLRRLVGNLLDNAVRHAAGTVAVTLAEEDGHALLDVADDGPGIPAEHHDTVFDRFTRLDHARARDSGGSGLGLPIARDIARAHRASLRVVPGESGARLRAVFPLRCAASGGRRTVGNGG